MTPHITGVTAMAGARIDIDAGVDRGLKEAGIRLFGADEAAGAELRSAQGELTDLFLVQVEPPGTRRKLFGSTFGHDQPDRLGPEPDELQIQRRRDRPAVRMGVIETDDGFGGAPQRPSNIDHRPRIDAEAVVPLLHRRLVGGRDGAGDHDAVRVDSPDQETACLVWEGAARVCPQRIARRTADGGLTDDTILLPGHNYSHVPRATLAETKAQNTYLNVKDLATWKYFMG